MEDAEIVGLYWSRSEQALTETEKKFSPYLTSIAYNILADRQDTEESVNDTYLAAWNSIPPHRPGVLATYLGKLTRRISIDRWRSRQAAKRRPSEYALSLTELESCIPGGGTPEEALDVQLLAEALSRFLRKLPRETRTLFVARYYFLDSLGAAARCCGMTEGQAKSRLFRARLALRDYLTKEGFLP